MTTRVTVQTSGECYPARIVIKQGGSELENVLIPGNTEWTRYVHSGQTFEISEEYHAAGYKPPETEA